MPTANDLVVKQMYMLIIAQNLTTLGEGVAGKSNVGTNSPLLSTVLLISVFERDSNRFCHHNISANL